MLCSAYFFSLLSSLGECRGYSASLIFRNELGTSLPFVINRSTNTSAAAVLASLVRDTAHEPHDDAQQHATWIGLFGRNKFSVRMTVQGSNKAGVRLVSRQITFVVMKHDFAALETDAPHYSAIQPFVAKEGIPLPVCVSVSCGR